MKEMPLKLGCAEQPWRALQPASGAVEPVLGGHGYRCVRLASVVVPGELPAPVPKFCVPRPQFRCAMIVLEAGSEMSAPGVVCLWVSFVSGDNAAVPGEGSHRRMREAVLGATSVLV